MRALSAALATAALMVACSSCSADLTLEERFSTPVQSRLQSALEETQRRLGAPGMMAGIWVPGAGSWFGAAGVSDPATGAPMRSDQSIRIGSVTKTFTVTLLLRLADEKVVRLDDPVARWVPDVPGGNAVTLRQLANMTAGLASYTFDPSWQQAFFSNPARRWTPTELVSIGFEETNSGCATFPRQCFAPGTRFFYSNTNTVLLAMALEGATKRPYAELLRTYVTEPLGMKHTFQPADEKLPEPYVHGVTSQGTEPGEPLRDATSWSPSWAFGVGDLVSTVDDLRIWARALGSGALLSDAMKKERFTTVTFPPNGPGRAYALGIGYDQGWWGHSGELPGYNTVVYYRPDIDAVLVVASSRDEVEIAGQALRPANVLADRIVAIASEEAPLGDLREDDLTTER